MTGTAKPTGDPVTIHPSTPFGFDDGMGAPVAMRKNRVHKRVSLHTEVWKGEDGIFTRGNERLADLSVGGAFIQGAGTTIGSILNLRFRLPGSDDFITATAIGRNTRDGGLGVQFLDLSPENLKRLAAFVDENS